MITIFNRRELIITFDLKLQADIRNKLADYNIDYVVNPFQLSGYAGEYKIYVRKCDYALALAVINDRIK